ncbi:hypothetical protein BN1708_018593, partial [Verticillium longisporum]
RLPPVAGRNALRRRAAARSSRDPECHGQARGTVERGYDGNGGRFGQGDQY